jgi:hypothetical protein
MNKPEPQMFCTTDHFFALELRDRIERGSPLAPEEWQFLARLLDKLELASLDAGFPEDWL